MLRARVGVFVVALTACLSVACGAPSGGADAGVTAYGSYQIDPGHSGYITGGKLKPPLTQLWTPLVAAGGSTYPIVVSGVLYVVTYPNVGSGLGMLNAVTASTGVPVWPPVNVANATALGVGDGLIVVTTTNGVVTAFKTSDATEVWTEILPADSTGLSVPVLQNGVLYINNASGNIWALDDSTGAVIWNSGIANTLNTVTTMTQTMTSSTVFQTGVPYAVGPLAVGDGLVVGQGNSAAVNGLDSSSGKLRWTFALTGSAGWAPAIFGSQAAVSGSSEGGLAPGGILLDLAGGMQDGVNLPYISTVTPVSDGTSSYTVNAPTGTLSSTNLVTNALSWNYTPSGDEALTAEPLLVNGVIYTASAMTGTLYAVSTSGKGLWSDGALGWIDPQTSSLPGTIGTLRWGTMGSDGNYLAVATTNSVAVYGSN